MPPSLITLRALAGTPLEDERLRALVTAAANALAERHAVLLLDIRTTEDAVTCTLDAPPIVAIGFAAELRRTTEAWYRHTHDGASLWGEVEHPDDDAADDWWRR